MADIEYLIIDDLTQREILRIFKHVSIDPVTRCWNWTASLIKGGYASIKFRGRPEMVHRIMYAWFKEPIPRGKQGKDIPNLDHIICNNPKCCNPKHLILVPEWFNVMRGNSPTSINARMIYCKNGHLLPDKPNYRNRRICQVCRYEKNKKYQTEHREEFLSYMNGYYRRRKLSKGEG